MSEAKVRWGVLGAARIIRRFIPGIQAADNAELVAIASRDAAKSKAAAEQWGAPVAYGSYEELLTAPDVDAIYIPLPNTFHAEWAIKAAQAGKHVLCEKPLALSVEEVERVASAAQSNHVNVMEGFMYRFHPQQARVRQLIEADAIGEPRVIRSTFAFAVAAGYNIRLDSSMGGGATWDVGTYAINVTRLMFGAEPVRVFAEATMQQGVDVSVAAIMDFEGERRAVTDYGINYGRRSFYEVIGTKGTLAVENMWQEPNVPGYVYLRNDKGLTTEEFPLTNHFALEVEAFSQAVLEGKPAPYPLSDTAANVRACVALLRSMQEGKPVQV
ncbi:MAG TPA: Gfo/Idh/MocA family oxidoreductase [Chloroflexia bacterium]|nr:Gfo/Idh/MocA family oxidoreductase [Chloroflexia bacterium]